ncbi:molybdenum cofactor cytidylyltransferase [Desulfovibrionales bacterium]
MIKSYPIKTNIFYNIAPDIAVIILAAGTSRRMGCPKLLLPWHGQPLVAHVLNTVYTTGLHPIMLTYNPHDPASSALIALVVTTVPPNRINPHLIPVPNVAAGQAASLAAALAALPHNTSGALVLLGDMPQVTAHTIHRILAAFAAAQHAFVVPYYQGHRGNPVLIPAVWFPQIQTLTGDTGASPFLNHPYTPITKLCLNSPTILADIDTPTDYATLLDTNIAISPTHPLTVLA